MTLKKREFTPESGSVDTYAIIASPTYLTVTFIQKSLKIAIIVTVGDILFEKVLQKRK